jgi:hypothetical protein
MEQNRATYGGKDAPDLPRQEHTRRRFADPVQYRPRQLPVQGWKVAHQPDLVEIPAGLLRYLVPGTDLDVPLRSTGKHGRDDHGDDWETFVVTGAVVSDPAVLAQLNIPDHESCVEVGLRRKDDDGATAAGCRI